MGNMLGDSPNDWWVIRRSGIERAHRGDDIAVMMVVLVVKVLACFRLGSAWSTMS